MSKLSKIWLSSPHMGGQEQSFIKDAFDTNWIAPLGPNVKAFERDLQAKSGAKAALALSSGTAAIHLAMDLLDVGPGDFVLVQSFTFCGSANPVIYRGANPVFIDSERETWNMDPKVLQIAIDDLKSRGQGDRIKAIIPVHLYGMPAKMDEIITISQNEGIPIVEDAAESLGSTYKGKFTGTLGWMGVYSFNGNKIITTSSGGALISNDEKAIQNAFHLSTQARDDAPHYQHSKIGYNYRLSNILAGVGRGQLEVLGERVAQRRKNFDRYQKYFSIWENKGYSVEFQNELDGFFSNRWLSAVLIDPENNKGLDREKIRLSLEEENIEARPLWKPMHMQPVFSDAPFYTTQGLTEDSGGKHSVSGRLFAEGLCLPSGSNLSEEDWIRIIKTLDSIIEK